MALEQFNRIQFQSVPGESAEDGLKRLAELFNRLQDSIAEALDQYTNNDTRPGNNYIYLEGVELTNAGNPTLVPHKLGRKVRGYRVTRQTAAADIDDDLDTTTEDTAKFLPLNVSADCTVDLEVF